MKTTLLIALLLCTAAAFGQAQASISGQPQPTTFAEHPLHAEPHSMATEKPIVRSFSDSYAYGQGEQPLWQFGPISQPTPLGDVARAYRKDKTASKKAEVVLEKQGS